MDPVVRFAPVVLVAPAFDGPRFRALLGAAPAATLTLTGRVSRPQILKRLEALQENTRLTAAERLRAFGELPQREQDRAWAALRQAIERGREGVGV